MGHYDNCRPGYCPKCGAAPGNLLDGYCEFCNTTEYQHAKLNSSRYAAIHEAAKIANKNAAAAVSCVVEMLNMATAANDASEVQNIMDEATRAGFHCEFWPNSIRVEWRIKVPAS